MSLARVAARSGLGILVLLLPLLLGACATTIRRQSFPALQERPADLSRVAVAPFALAPSAVRDAVSPSVPDLVARQLAEELTARGIAVTPPEDVGHALEAAGIADPAADPAATARLVAQQFGATALVLGRVTRYLDREGQRLGAKAPASAGFEATLLRAPEGDRLWTGVFDETQQPLTDNVFNMFRYPGAGTRWLTGHELVQWGAQAMAAALAEVGS
jgi:hypothetical protein